MVVNGLQDSSRRVDADNSCVKRGDLEAMFDQWALEDRRQVAYRLPGLRAGLSWVFMPTAAATDEWSETCRRLGAYIGDLPDDDLRLVLLASFEALDIVSVFEDYLAIHVGCDTFGYTAIPRYVERHGHPRSAEQVAAVGGLA